MKLTTIGTGHGIPRKERLCTANLLTVGNARYIFDCAEGTGSFMIHHDVPFDELRGIFLTHQHDDHTGGLTGVMNAYFCLGKQTIPLFYPERGFDKLMGLWMDLNWTSKKCSRLLEFRLVEPGVIFEDENIKVTAIPNDHVPHHEWLYPLSFSYQIEAEGKKIYLTGDLTYDFHDFPTQLFDEETDLILCESAHFRPEEHLDAFAKLKTKRLLFGHIGDMYQGEGRKILQGVCNQLPFEAGLSEDGETYII